MRAWPLVFLAALACGKTSVSEVPPSQRWDPPTPANGFLPLTQACEPVDGGKIFDSQMGTLEDIGGVATAVATDEGFVYTVVNRNELHRLERAPAPWPTPWRDELFYTSQHGPIVDLAVSDARIYWVVDGREGPHQLYAADKTTFTRTLVKTFDGRIERLFGRKSGVAIASRNGIEQIDDDGSPTMPPELGDGRLVAVTDDDAIVYQRSGFLSTLPRQPWRQIAHVTAAENAIAAATDLSFLYWIERADQSEEGKLRRVPRAGGVPADLFVGIPYPEALAIVKGVVWISTGRGLLRYDPTCHLAPTRIAGTASLQGRAVPFGEALAVMARRPRERVALLAVP